MTVTTVHETPIPPVPTLDPPTITADDLQHEVAIVWLVDGADSLPYVRQMVLLAPSADGPLLWPQGPEFGLLGWATLSEDAPLLGGLELHGKRWGWHRRRAFYRLAGVDPTRGIGVGLGVWPGAPAWVTAPGAVVDPATIRPGVLGTLTARAVIGNRGELHEAAERAGDQEETPR